MTFRIPTAALCALVFAAWLFPAAAQQPTFRSGVELVTVDVTILDARGNPVADLAREEFALTVDGEPRRIVWAQYVPYRVPASPGDAPRPAHFSSNEHVDPGRLMLIAVDQANIRRIEGRGALRAAGRFIDALHPSDRVAAAPLTYTGAIHFTDDHAGVKQALDGLMGEQAAMPVQFSMGLTEVLAISDGSKALLDQVVRRECGESLAQLQSVARAADNEGMRDPCPTQIEQEARALAQYTRTQTSLSVKALQRLIARLGEIDGPKVLVLLSEGLVAEPQLVDMTELGAVAQASRVTIYVLQLETPIVEAADDKISPTLFQDIQVRADGLARLAGSARGALFRLVGADPNPFNRITRELSGYHLLAFEPGPSDRDGRPHRISVKVGREGVTVRARQAFKLGYEPGPAGAGEDRLVQLLRSSRFATELPLRVATYAQQQRGDRKVGVLISAETEAGGPDVSLGFVIVDQRGVVVTSASHRTTAGVYSFSAALDPGPYLLRAVAVDATGRAGSVERRFEAQLRQQGSLQVSDLLLAEGVRGSEKETRPTVDRATRDRVTAQVELYGPPTLRVGQEAVTLEIARDESSAPLVTAPVVIARPSVGRWIARADLSLEHLPPGRYVARAIIDVPGTEPQRITRPFERR
jgi:VWFA-related protein